jgi:mannitol-1-/sugar-/sorbitol-6-phosphatase
MADINYDAVAFDLFGTLVDQTATAVDGALERLEELRGATWAIVTSANAPLAEVLVARAGLPRPPVLITGDDVARNKPAPDGYVLAARKLGVETGRVLVFEDTPAGVAAARGAGMDVVAVLNGRSNDFARAATFVVRDLTKLRLRWIEGAVVVEFGKGV